MPECILLFSGKRKSGKDFLTDKLKEKFNNAVIIKISAPIKAYFASENNLSLDNLMSSADYKERYRLDMIKWSEGVRAEDPGVFCRKAIELYQAKDVPIWIVSDVRRESDIVWFKQAYPDKVRVIRVNADEQVRKRRGFTFCDGVDNAPSECNLDNFQEWDWIIDNNDEGIDWEEKMKDVTPYLRQY